MTPDLYFILNDAREPVPVSNAEWLEWVCEANRRVGYTEIGERTVSTVFFGVNMSHHSDGPPLLFETMIFDEDGDALGYQTRCATYAEAVTMHELACRFVRAGLH